MFDLYISLHIEEFDVVHDGSSNIMVIPIVRLFYLEVTFLMVLFLTTMLMRHVPILLMNHALIMLINHVPILKVMLLKGS